MDTHRIEIAHTFADFLNKMFFGHQTIHHLIKTLFQGVIYIIEVIPLKIKENHKEGVFYRTRFLTLFISFKNNALKDQTPFRQKENCGIKFSSIVKKFELYVTFEVLFLQ